MDRPNLEHFDAVIVGAGQAGPPLAERLCKAGRRVAIVERGHVGGTCVNSGCTPTKAMVASAYVARLAARAQEFGVELTGPPRVDLKAVKARADQVVEAHRHAVGAWLDSLTGCALIRGHARFIAPKTLAVGDRIIAGEQVFLNVGGRAATPPMSGLDQVPYMTNVGIVALQDLPRHLVIVGGSYIGLEFAQMFRRFGAEVTVIERSARLLPREDDAISHWIEQILEAEGVSLRLGADCVRFAPDAGGIAAIVDCEAGPPQIVGSHLLLAVGRRPNTDDLGLEAAGIQTDERGYVRVDETLRTTAPDVWALGVCNGRGAFTHTAYNDFEIVAANLLDGQQRSLAERTPTYALFIDPPLGRAGLTEREARATGRPVRVGKRAMAHVARAVEKGESQGMMSVVVDAETDRILGAAILGPGGDEAVHGLLGAIAAGLPYTRLQRTMPIHPTVSELIPTMLEKLSAPVTQAAEVKPGS
jgi:pyruvate/2-oxoglutarate dehydrogenase complex dihydrolipoamide dehydrogenase (E3) component